jgi:hypothetical protein
MQFRVEYFNLLNHTKLGDPNVSNPVGSSTSFGTVTATNPSTDSQRIAQFSLKYVF